MGIEYALVKRDTPESFDLGKGSCLGGWPKVFGRRHGWFPLRGRGGNFEQPFRLPRLYVLFERIQRYDDGYSGNAWEVAERILQWAGDSDVFLINYWEFVEEFQEANDREGCESQFRDLRPQLCCSLYDYKETGSVWE